MHETASKVCLDPLSLFANMVFVAPCPQPCRPAPPAGISPCSLPRPRGATANAPPRSRVVTAAALPLDPTLTAAATAGVAALIAGGASIVADARVDYAVTARLKAVLPPGATTALFVVLAPRSASRDLFLLPDAVDTVTILGPPNLDTGYWGRAGVQAGVRVTTSNDPSTLPPASAGVALARGALSSTPPGDARNSLLAAVARSLAPGAVLIAVERLADANSLPWRRSGTDLTTPALEALLENAPGWGRVAVDVVGDGVAVVVAQRDTTVLGSGGQPKRGGGKTDVEAVVPVKKGKRKASKGFQ